jgi:hypothetical protein
LCLFRQWIQNLFWNWGSHRGGYEECSPLNTLQFIESPMLWITSIFRLLSASAGFLLNLLFSREDGGDVPLKWQTLSKLHDIVTKKIIPYIVSLVELSPWVWFIVMCMLPGFLPRSNTFTHMYLKYGSRIIYYVYL